MLTKADLAPLPLYAHLIAGCDTGTYMSAVFVLFPPESFDCFVLEEFPNYRYVGGEIELLGNSIPEWSREVLDAYRRYYPDKTKCKLWVDANSQFRQELKNYDLVLIPNNRKLELRVEIAREYFDHRRVFLAPWLTILPYELEHAMWPDETTSAGKFERLKEKDHTLDCLEHVLSRRPRSKRLVEERKPSFLEQHFNLHRRVDAVRSDVHLGLRP